jgi:hypothetical protein
MLMLAKGFVEGEVRLEESRLRLITTRLVGFCHSEPLMMVIVLLGKICAYTTMRLIPLYYPLFQQNLSNKEISRTEDKKEIIEYKSK